MTRNQRFSLKLCWSWFSHKKQTDCLSQAGLGYYSPRSFAFRKKYASQAALYYPSVCKKLIKHISQKILSVSVECIIVLGGGRKKLAVYCKESSEGMTSGVNIYTGVGGEIPSKKKERKKGRTLWGEKRKKKLDMSSKHGRF